MSKHVHIVGLYAKDLEGTTQEDLKATGDVWTCNDWYWFYPWMTKPDSVFNIHFAPHVHISDMTRFPGAWMTRYNEVIQRGGRIVVVDQIKGVNPDGQVFLPPDLVKVFSMDSCLCSISAMILMAAYEGYEQITLHGVRLTDDEYRSQVLPIERAIVWATGKGCVVNNPYTDEWDKRSEIISWENDATIDCGSMPHLVRYFKPELVDLDNLEITTG